MISSSLSWQTCLGKAEGYDFRTYVRFDIYDHNLRRIGHPVRSDIYKPYIGSAR